MDTHTDIQTHAHTWRGGEKQSVCANCLDGSGISSLGGRCQSYSQFFFLENSANDLADAD